MSGIAGIVLAAGEGRRAGGVKALLTMGGRTLLDRVVTAMREAGCENVIVVGGADGARVEAEASRLAAGFVLNEHWPKGQFSSLRAGAKALAAGSAGAPPHGAAALVALVDHPAVKTGTYRALLDAHAGAPGSIVIPVCEDGRTGRAARGHPVVLPSEVVAEVAAAPDGVTLRDLIRRNAELVLEVPVDDAGVLKDIDTVADLKDVGGPESWTGERRH